MSVLIVDDHAPFRQYLRLLLEDDGFEVVADVGDGAHATAVASRFGPDLVVLDIHLGEGPDGFALARELARMPAPPAVILTSSRDRSAYVDRIRSAPVAGFVPKEELSPAVIRALMAQPRAARIAIAEDSLLFREGIARVLDDLGFCVVGQVSDGGELLDLLAVSAPDVAVVDIRMPPTFTNEGITTAGAIAERFPSVGVMVLSQHLEPDYAIRLIEDRPSGRGYLLKDRVGDLPGFAEALRRVAAGGLAVDAEVVNLLMTQATDPLASLTERESEVLRMMAEGLSNDGIASGLVLSPRTVEAHVSRILDKLGLDRSAGQNPRVMAVLQFLQSQPGQRR